MSGKIYDSLDDAPKPTKDGEHVYIDLDATGWLIHYISRGGQWVMAGHATHDVAH